MTERALALLSDAIVTISPRQYADITERFKVAPARKTHLIPLGFDLHRFDGVERHRGELRAELGVDDEPIVSSVGRLTSIKDHALLLRAFQRLAPGNAHMCVVGGGELEADLKALARALGIAPRVHFLGFRSDLERILADTDVLALSSVNEGTPVVLIEALAAGCSVVGTAVGGVADVLEDGRWGHLVPERSPEAYGRALAAALSEHRARSAESLARGKAYVRSKYGIDRLVGDHALLYETLIVRAGSNMARLMCTQQGY
jgi:glycosyltransferase involved in cell wall biosynthesis